MLDEDYQTLLSAIGRLEVGLKVLETRVTEVWEAIATTTKGPGILETQRQQQAAIAGCDVRMSRMENDYGGRVTTIINEVRALTLRVAELERAPEKAATKELEEIHMERLRGRQVWREGWIRAIIGGIVGALGTAGAILLLLGQQIRHWLSGSP